MKIPKLQAFHKALKLHRKPKSDDPYDNRVTHCHLIYFKDGKPHRFEVRGFPSRIKNHKLSISAVNWSLCAGTCSIELTEDKVHEWLIEEDQPNYRLLFNEQ